MSDVLDTELPEMLRAALDLLDWKAATSLSDGLTRTAAWLRASPQLWERYGMRESV